MKGIKYMRKYIKPQLELVKFDVEDVTLASNLSSPGYLITYGDDLGTVNLADVENGDDSFTITK